VKPYSPIRLALLALAAVGILTVGSFALARTLARGSVLGDVQALGVQVGGVSADELSDILQVAGTTLENRPAVFEVNGQATTLQPDQAGLEFDIAAIADAAMQVGRQGNISDQFRWWLGHFGDTETIPPIASIDPQSVEAILTVWDEDLVGNPPFPGAVELDGTTPVPSYPAIGEQIDRSVAESLIFDSLISDTSETVVLPVATVEPILTAADVDRAVARARLWLSAPVTLTSAAGDKSIRFTAEDMAAALRTTATPAGLSLGFDPDAIRPKLDAVRGELEQAPVDARFEPDGVNIDIVPGRAGTLIDAEATAESLERAAESASRAGGLPFIEGADPEVTTEELETLGVNHLVSQFTTYHDCCQNRVVNIHLFADTVDGTIVRPGEELSLNELVGPRTEEKGYLEDGTIVGGELTKTVGGGVSQFATTFYNAMFWGGYEDVTHKPHSFYFTRYPEGIESTISWPAPEVIFRNDSDAAIFIDTAYTDTSITVRFYGDNDGRSVALAWADGGPYQQEVLAEGGPNARVVTATVSERLDPRTPGDPEYRANPELAVDREVTVQSPADGWSVRITRTITVGGEPQIDEWVTVYSPRRAIIEVHPCKVPNTSVECPEPTTTTTEPASTTTPSTSPPETSQPETSPTTVAG
jgi:vancomycin resistance protein YoaR